MPSVLSSPKHFEREFDLPAASETSAKNHCWAAVSFLFEDACWCDWLYRGFDGARVPRTLQGKPSRDGLPYPERLSISPDPTDATQLENYAETLQGSHHLIIVVSPASGRADLIHEHMRMFKANGGEERVIALVVKGEPASPAAEPGNESDREWLPKWLGWRFENNAFSPAGRDEPTVVDARLGISSLAEVRAQLFAALLGVQISELAELGVIIRASSNEQILQATHPLASVLPPQPTPMSTFALAPPEPLPKHARWPVALCGVAALAALACLAFWPAPDFNPLPLPAATAAPAAQNRAPDTVAVAVEQKTEEAVPPAAVEVVAQAATAEPAIVAVKLEENVPQSAPPEPAPPEPVVQAVPTVAKPIQVPIEDQEIARKKLEFSRKRDRLIRLAETKMNTGDYSEALEVFELGIEAAKEIARLGNNDHNSVIELAVLYRRLGALASNTNSSAEARARFESGRRTLLALRASGQLPKEGAKVLSELENSIRLLPKD